MKFFSFHKWLFLFHLWIFFLHPQKWSSWSSTCKQTTSSDETNFPRNFSRFLWDRETQLMNIGLIKNHVVTHRSEWVGLRLAASEQEKKQSINGGKIKIHLIISRLKNRQEKKKNDFSLGARGRFYDASFSLFLMRLDGKSWSLSEGQKKGSTTKMERIKSRRRR